ncbi:MAG: toll/interleukin-1 receptor domain-containing protein [Bryobacterales bacterium]|nr:toll/interleukin-1 receptor domain-containing protein [Bryobacterales bacterium]
MVANRRSREAYRVFVSYSHKDRWIAKRIVREIENLAGRAVHVFLDEKDIEVGQHIAEEVREAIERCDEFVVLLSPNSKGREWVLIEMGAAWGLKKQIMTILHSLSPQEMPDITYPHKAVDLNDFDDVYLEQLRKRLKKGRK